MLKVSKAASNAFKEPYRDVSAELSVYFDGVNKAPTIIKPSTGLIDFKVLEEDASNNGSPFGSVSINELDVIIDNLDKKYTMDNTESILYGKLVANLRVDINYTITSSGVTTKVFGGTFYTQQWKASTTSNTVNMIAYDRFSIIADKRITSLPVYKGIHIREFLRYVFNNIKLHEGVDYVLDASLNTIVDFIWVSAKPLIDNLRDIAISLGLKMYINKENKIYVTSASIAKAAVDTYTDSDLVIKVDGTQSIFSAYSAVTISYKVPSVSDSKPVLSLTNVTLKPGINNFANLALSEGPALVITSIKVLGANNEVYVHDFTVGSFSLDLSIGNSGETTTVSIEVEAKVISMSDATYTLANKHVEALIGFKEYKMTIEIPRDIEYVKEYASKVLDVVSDPMASLKIDMRGYPVSEVGDVVRLTSDIVNADYDVLINRMEYTFNGSLMCTCTVTKAETLQKLEWVMVSPGLYTQVAV